MSSAEPVVQHFRYKYLLPPCNQLAPRVAYCLYPIWRHQGVWAALVHLRKSRYLVRGVVSMDAEALIVSKAGRYPKYGKIVPIYR